MTKYQHRPKPILGYRNPLTVGVGSATINESCTCGCGLAILHFIDGDTCLKQARVVILFYEFKDHESQAAPSLISYRADLNILDLDSQLKSASVSSGLWRIQILALKINEKLFQVGWLFVRKLERSADNRYIQEIAKLKLLVFTQPQYMWSERNYPWQLLGVSLHGHLAI